MGIDFDEWGFDDVSIENYLLSEDYQDGEVSEHDGSQFSQGFSSPYWDVNDMDEDESDAFYGRGAYAYVPYFTAKEKTYLEARASDIEKGAKIPKANSLNLSTEQQFLLKRDEILNTFDWSRLPQSAYHWIPLVNLKSILKYSDGLLSRTYLDIQNETLQRTTYLDISDRELSRWRSRTSLPDETLIADYVPFYFCDQPPMAYLAIKNGTTQRGIPPMEWAVIEISPTDLMKHQWWAINRHFHNTVRGLPLATNAISELAEFRWSSILSIGNFVDREVLDYRQAEFLLHMKCPVTKWKTIIVSSFETQHDLSEIDPLLSYKGVSVDVDPDFFSLDRNPRNSLPHF
jgi:hypothetical protein